MKRNRRIVSNPEDETEGTGSPPSGEPGLYLAIGRLRRPHGIEGEILMDILTDFPERIRARRWVYVGDDHQKLRISHVRKADRTLLISFEGYDFDEAVGRLRNKLMFVRAENLPNLPEDEYYHHQLLGMRVVTEDGQEVGFLSGDSRNRRQ